MITAWTKHIKDEESKEKFEAAVLGSRHVLERLQELVAEDVSSMDRSEMDIKSFDSPNWDYRQAWRQGL